MFFLFISPLTLTSQTYVFYLHGHIVEIQGANAVETNQGFGAYKYNDILDSLKSAGFIVKSEVRPPDTDVKQYASKVAAEIMELIGRGVDPSAISVIGASKGGYIAMEVSSLMKNDKLNFIVMGACPGSAAEKNLHLFGNVLFIREKTDNVENCEGLKMVSPGIKKYKDLEINTGLRHGFLYRPIKEWLQPAITWASGKYN
jgi:hypothetical protein